MSWSGVSAFQSPFLPIVESKDSNRNESSMSKWPVCNEAYGPPPRLRTAPKLLTVLTQLGTLRYGPTLAPMSWNRVTIWQASLIDPYVSRGFPLGPGKTASPLGAGLPVSFWYTCAQYAQ